MSFLENCFTNTQQERPTYFIRAAAGGGTNMILYSLFIIIYKKSTKQKSPAAGLAA